MPARTPLIPPGGFAGFAQQTPAVQALLRPTTTRKKRAKKKTTARKPATRRKTAKRTRSTGGRLKKGSPAAKRRMAELRAMRGKKRAKRKR